MATFSLIVFLFFVTYRVYDTIRFSNSCIFNHGLIWLLHLVAVFLRSHVTEAGFEIAL